MRFATHTSIFALAMASACCGTAQAQAVNTTVSNVNVLNLLAPFLTFNATAAGQATLAQNLSQTFAINNNATLQQQALSISDKNLFGGATNTITTSQGVVLPYGVAANLAGGLPDQQRTAGSTVTPSQPMGAYGAVLGPIYQNGVVSGVAGPLGSVVTLLTTAYNNNSSDLGVAKNYFANGAANNPSTTPPGYQPTPAVAPPGYTLPRANGLPNTTNSVYDLAYGVTNTQPNQDVYGDSRPVQVAPNRINSFDPTSLSGLATNPSFPSGHTTYAYTDSILLAMLTPSLYQSTVLRASEYGNSRIVLGVHYPLDIIGGRALASYDLAQAFTNPLYLNNAATTQTATNLPALFTAAQGQLASYLSVQCGAAVATCATSAANTANDPYVPSDANRALYQQRLTYGLPTLTFAQAPQEAAPAGGPDASILLAPLYGGSTAAARTLAPNGGIDGTLQTSTINQILVNTETNALAAVYGTPLSYWTRIDLYSAAGYFTGVSGTLTMASTDRITIPVTVGSTGTLYANGATLAGNVTVANGGAFGGGSATAAATATVGGNLLLQPGGSYAVTLDNNRVSSAVVAGTATLSGGTLRVSSTGNSLPFTQGQILLANGGVVGTFGSIANTGATNTLVRYGSNTATVTVNRTDVGFTVPGATTNENRVAGAIAAASPNVQAAATGAFLNTLYTTEQASAAAGATLLDRVSGEGTAATQNAAFEASHTVAASIEDEQRAWRTPGGAAPAGVTVGSLDLPTGAIGYADATHLGFPPTKGPVPTLAAPQRLWRAWGGGFGGSNSIDGVAGLGTARQSDEFFGGLVGVDYQARPDLLIGVAGGGSSSDFRVPDRATSGTVTGGHGSVYAAYGALSGFYAEGSVTFSGFSNDVTRTAGGIGGVAAENERARFDSFEVRVRSEVGQRFAMNGAGFNSLGVTPFAALEYANLSTDGYQETAAGAGAPGLLSLAVAGRSIDSLPVFAGLRLDGILPVGGMLARPFAQVAYVHEFEPTRNLRAGFVSLPGATFLVEGARPAEDGAQVKTGVELAVRPGVTLFANFDGEFSGVQTVYGGRGGLRVNF